MKELIGWNDFEKIDFRCGTITAVELFPEANKPAYKLSIDFGEKIGLKRASAQITDRYAVNDLVGKQVLAIVNFPPKQIGPFMSECLVCGFYTPNGIVLVEPKLHTPNGSSLG